METVKNLIEYYDELFPITDAQREFYNQLIKNKSQPMRFLRVNCGTGLFETQLSKEGCDVTGTENLQDFLNAANLRRRTQLMSIRFFLMQPDEILKFLGKGFYDVISILDSRIMFISSKQEMQKLFCDLKQLLKPDGSLIIHMINFEKYNAEQNPVLPERTSLRVSMQNELSINAQNVSVLHSEIETGNGRRLSVAENVPVYELVPCEIEEFAENAGFSSAEFYADYERHEFTEDSDYFFLLS